MLIKFGRAHLALCRPTQTETNSPSVACEREETDVHCQRILSSLTVDLLQLSNHVHDI